MAQKCIIKNYKGKEHHGVIIDKKMDKVRVNILESKGGVLIKTDWFEGHEIKRLWE